MLCTLPPGDRLHPTPQFLSSPKMFGGRSWQALALVSLCGISFPQKLCATRKMMLQARSKLTTGVLCMGETLVESVESFFAPHRWGRRAWQRREPTPGLWDPLGQRGYCYSKNTTTLMVTFPGYDVSKKPVWTVFIYNGSTYIYPKYDPWEPPRLCAPGPTFYWKFKTYEFFRIFNW